RSIFLKHYNVFCTIARCSSPVLSPDYGGNSLAIPQVSALLIICGRS
ncbi:TPA: LysR family transcriptional regulator, partial [Klebsiella pneumoniae]|nr:LysR family transcriptional regulator [Klebsiella pneumoniae]